MAFQTPITIKEALQHIQQRSYVLPAIQRELVWGTEQIELLFDSLMRGYPIGSFLFWRVKRENAHEYKFYDFVLNYHQRDKSHNQPLPVQHTNSDLIAILDGQQRLTALYIGLLGSYSSKLPRLRWNNPQAFPLKRLYLNILGKSEEDEDGIQYKFRFLTEAEADRRDRSTYWYRVGDILNIDDSTDLIDVVHDLELGNTREPQKILARLHRVVHDERIIAHYEEGEQDLHKVLNIFVRTNSGGTVLSYSDILLSIATAQWDEVDARQEIYGLVDDLNRIKYGFLFSRDLVLKAGLMLSETNDIGFKVTNFNTTNMTRIQNNWNTIKESILKAVELVADFGYSAATLSAANAVLPIAYYIHRNKLGAELLGSERHKPNRDAIRFWLIRSLLKRGVWGSGLDTFLMAIRRVIRESQSSDFPTDHIESMMRQLGKNLTFDEEELEDLVDTRYGNHRAYGILALLYPFVDVRTHQFHMDHIFPRSLMTTSKLRRAGVDEKNIEDWVDRANGIANLQLLADIDHHDKGTNLPTDWLNSHFSDKRARQQHMDLHDLGEVPADITGFNEFYEARRDRMLCKLRNLLGVSATNSAITRT